ncbi:hypothetical protein OC845_006495 [Tilletia horrida]|nr:hypothetical protein OC845_006495 [Tilletia horrida]
MASVLDSYSVQLRSSLPDLDHAEQRFKRAGGLTKIQAALAEVAKQHPSSDRFGLHLLHRHSDLEDDEIMVESGPATQPYHLADLSPAAISGLRASVWGLSQDTKKFTPLQFAFGEEDSGKGMDDLDAALAEAVADVLVQHGLEHVFGLAATEPGQEMMLETTHGRAEILIPARQLAKGRTATEVLWPLSGLEPGDGTAECRQACMKDYSGGAHSRIHLHYP